MTESRQPTSDRLPESSAIEQRLKAFQPEPVEHGSAKFWYRCGWEAGRNTSGVSRHETVGAMLSVNTPERQTIPRRGDFVRNRLALAASILAATGIGFFAGRVQDASLATTPIGRTTPAPPASGMATHHGLPDPPDRVVPPVQAVVASEPVVRSSTTEISRAALAAWARQRTDWFENEPPPSTRLRVRSSPPQAMGIRDYDAFFEAES